MKPIWRYAAGVARRMTPFLPAGLRLGFRYRAMQYSGTMEEELRHLDSFVGRRDVALDVGANVGFYTYRLARLFPRVLAFEPNDGVTHDLKSWMPPHVQLIEKAISSHAGEATLKLPWVGGGVYDGWASLEPNNLPTAERYTEKTVKLDCLDSWINENVSFIKIDVEGHELEVLRGASKLIAKHRPVVLTEVRDANRYAVTAYFSELKYDLKRLSDFVRAEPSPENFIFVPRG